MRAKFSICGLIAAFSLYACGGDSSTQTPADDNTVQETISSSEGSSDGTSSGKVLSSGESTGKSSSTDKPNSSSSTDSGKADGFPVNYDPETGLVTDERDGDVYKTAKIGEQIWMAENMRIVDSAYMMGCEHYFPEDWKNPPDSILKKHGRFYSWITVMQLSCDYEDKLAVSAGTDSAYHTPNQGLCPKGWHVPTIAEWQTLLNQGPVTKLLSTEWDYKNPDYKGTDDYGFSLPIPNENVESYPCYFTANEKGADKASIICFHTMPNKPVDLGYCSKSQTTTNYFRCLMD